jgi:hypothetical protein
MKLMEIIENMEAEQKKIAMINAQAQAMQARAQNFLFADENGQADMVADARMQLAQMAQKQNPQQI